MLPLTDLKLLVQDRLQDADVLFAARRYDGCYYLCGYAAELGLKARICRTLGWNEFPQRGREFRGLESLRTHDLEILLKLSGVETKIRKYQLAEWSVVVLWNPEKRYESPGKTTPTIAKEMLDATKTLVGAL